MLSEGLWRHKHEGDLEVMGGYGIERGRSLLDMTEICPKFQQCGQGSARSEKAKVCTAVKIEHARAGRFISGSDSREPSESERSRGQ